VCPFCASFFFEVPLRPGTMDGSSWVYLT
jgi:hypothetical protein